MSDNQAELKAKQEKAFLKLKELQEHLSQLQSSVEALSQEFKPVKKVRTDIYSLKDLLKKVKAEKAVQSEILPDKK